MQSLWLIIVVFFIVLLILPIFCKLHVSYDLFNNLGAISIYVFFIKIISFKLKFEDFELVLYTQKKEKQIEAKFSEKQMRFLKQLNVQFKQKIIIRKINAYSRIGVQDASISAITTGLFNALTGSLLAYIKNSKTSTQITIKSEPNYNGKTFTIAFYCSLVITLFDVIYGLIMSFMLVKRSEKYERI